MVDKNEDTNIYLEGTCKTPQGNVVDYFRTLIPVLATNDQGRSGYYLALTEWQINTTIMVVLIEERFVNELEIVETYLIGKTRNTQFGYSNEAHILMDRGHRLIDFLSSKKHRHFEVECCTCPECALEFSLKYDIQLPKLISATIPSQNRDLDWEDEYHF